MTDWFKWSRLTSNLKMEHLHDIAYSMHFESFSGGQIALVLGGRPRVVIMKLLIKTKWKNTFISVLEIHTTMEKSDKLLDHLSKFKNPEFSIEFRPSLYQTPYSPNPDRIWPQNPWTDINKISVNFFKWLIIIMSNSCFSFFLYKASGKR